MSSDHDRARAAGAHRRDDDRPRVGAQPVRAFLARPRGGGRRALPGRGRGGDVVVTSPDYDGKGKLLVRLDDGTERIVGASRVEVL